MTLKAAAWDYRSVVPLLNRMGAACGLTTTLRAARDFVSRYLLMAKAAIRLCRKIALEPLTTFTPTTRRVESVVDRVVRPWPRQLDGVGQSVPETLVRATPSVLP